MTESVPDRDCFDRFAPYLARWALQPDGHPIVTPAARLLPVRHHGEPAMLKVALESEEKHGGTLLAWWDGDGAARLLAAHDDAILLERAQGARSLSDFARQGRDDEATTIICETIAKLHRPRRKPLPDLISLPVWFRELDPVAASHGGILARAAQIAHALLADQREIGVLHGDIHHDNILDFGARGWLAIDPKRLYGERAFDYANIFGNPDLADPSRPVATLPGRFARRLDIVVAQAGLDRHRLLQWIVAWSGLSAAWFIGDDGSPEIDLAVAAFALAEIDR